MVFYVILVNPVFKFYETWDQVKKVIQKLYCQSLIHAFDFDKKLKLVVKNEKKYC